MSRKTAAQRNDKMDSLIQAINRLAESQEKANERMEMSYELSRQNFEMNMKQYALNLETSEYNKSQNEEVKALKLKEQEQMEEAIEVQKQVMNNVKSYVDENINSIIKMLSQEQKVMGSYLKGLETKIDTKADKADEKEIAESIWKRLSRNARTRTDGLPPKR